MATSYISVRWKRRGSDADVAGGACERRGVRDPRRGGERDRARRAAGARAEARAVVRAMAASTRADATATLCAACISALVFFAAATGTADDVAEEPSLALLLDPDWSGVQEPRASVPSRSFEVFSDATHPALVRALALAAVALLGLAHGLNPHTR